MTSNVGEALRAALAAQQLAKDMKEKSHLPPYQQDPGRVINNVNRTTFEYVRDNPGTRAQITDALAGRGFKEGSVGALISAMLRQGVAVRDADGILRTTIKEYIPIKNSSALKRAQAKAERQAKRKKVVVTVTRDGKSVPLADTKHEVRQEAKPEVQRPVSISSVWTARDALSGLSVLQARELFDELKKIFGDAK